MDFLRDLKVKSKLLLILIVFTVVAVVISWKGLSTSSLLNDEITSIIDTNVSRIEYANEITIALMAMQRIEKNAILAETTEETQKYISRFKESVDRFNEMAKKLEEVASVEGKKQLEKCIDSKNEYEKVANKIFELTLAKNNTQAILISQTEGREKVDNCGMLLNKLI